MQKESFSLTQMRLTLNLQLWQSKPFNTWTRLMRLQLNLLRPILWNVSLYLKQKMILPF